MSSMTPTHSTAGGRTATTERPWMAAAAYSSVVGVPIVNGKGNRVANTAMPNLPKEWQEVKDRAIADAELICKAVNNHDALVSALACALGHIEHMAAFITKQNAGYSFESLGEDMPDLRAALARTGGAT